MCPSCVSSFLRWSWTQSKKYILRSTWMLIGLALCVNSYIVELCTVTKKYPINTIDTLFHQKLLGELFLRVKWFDQSNLAPQFYTNLHNRILTHFLIYRFKYVTNISKDKNKWSRFTSFFGTFPWNNQSRSSSKMKKMHLHKTSLCFE